MAPPHLDDLARPVQARGRQRLLGQRGALYHRSRRRIKEACFEPGFDSQDFRPARQEGDQTHEARHTQLGYLLVLPDFVVPSVLRVEQVVQTCQESEQQFRSAKKKKKKSGSLFRGRYIL